MDKQSFLASGMVEKYILGLTTEEEDRIVEAFMEAHGDIKSKIFDGQDCIYEKSKTYATTSKIGSDSLTDDTLRKIEEVENEYSNISPAIGKWFQFAIMGLLAFSTFYYWNEMRSISFQNQNLSSELKKYEDANKTLIIEKATLTSNEFILTHFATERVQLKGTNLSPDASMMAFYNPKAETLMIKIEKLPPPPDDKYYHMWADVNGKMIHIGTLSNNAINLTSLNFVSQASSLNVTIEDLPDIDHPDVSRLVLSGAL